MNDYARIAGALEYLKKHRLDQPSLEDLATACNLSSTHLHRLFQRWAGITPKAFLKHLTAESAKTALRKSSPVLEAALESGLSGPGRLHDLMLSVESATPGEWKSGGEGMRVEWGLATTPFGIGCIGWNSRGVCHLSFQDSSNQDLPPSTLRKDWPLAETKRSDAKAENWAAKIFRQRTPADDGVRAYVQGTVFQLRVWRALLDIPEGYLLSYGGLAKKIGAPQAARAVGTACGANRIAFLIPCHRVIRETGALDGYRWGGERKRLMLAWEAARTAERNEVNIRPD